MRIKKIKYKKHPILGNLELDFTSENNKAEDIIFLAGENGCGKTTIIDNIFDVIAYKLNYNGEYTIIYLLELNDNDIEFVKKWTKLIFIRLYI